MCFEIVEKMRLAKELFSYPLASLVTCFSCVEYEDVELGKRNVIKQADR